jgi:small subunit ribosomal protein S6
VDKYREGTYVLFQFSAEPELVREFERRLRVADLVLKFLTVRVDQTLKRLDKRKKARDKRAAKHAANAGASVAAATPGPAPAQPTTEGPAAVPGMPKES